MSETVPDAQPKDEGPPPETAKGDVENPGVVDVAQPVGTTTTGSSGTAAVPSGSAAHRNNVGNKSSKKSPLKTIMAVTVLVAVVALTVTLGVTLNKDDDKKGDDALGVVVTPKDDIVGGGGGGGGEDGGSDPPQEFEEIFVDSNGPLLAKIRMFSPGIVNGYESCSNLEEDIKQALLHYANTIITENLNYDYYEKCDPDDPCNNYAYGYNYGCGYRDDGGAIMEGGDTASPSGSGPTMDSDQSSSKQESDVQEEDSFGTNNQVFGVDEADIVKSDGDWVFAGYGDVLYVWHATKGGKGGVSITNLPYNDTNLCPDDGNNGVGTGGGDPKPSPDWVDVSVGMPVSEGTSVPEMTVTETASSGSSSGSSTVSSARGGRMNRKNNRHRRADVMYKRPYYNCDPPKPRILSILANNTRLTVIVSQRNNNVYTQSTIYDDVDGDSDGDDTDKVENLQPIISDYEKLTVRVYDISVVPTDGSPLPLLGVRNIQGSYNDARSIGERALIVSTASVNTYLFAEDLYRHHFQYCGLNNTRYQELASETALAKVEAFAKRMVEELKLSEEGAVDGASGCTHIFQLAAMQSGGEDNDEEANSEGFAPSSRPLVTDLLGQFVQVTSFNMLASFETLTEGAAESFEVVPNNIPAGISGAFAQSGYLKSVYAKQNFLATLNTGSSYNPDTSTWEQSTYVLGFELMSADAPTPFCAGKVPGDLINQYAADLHKGHLRLATTTRDWSNTGTTTENKIYVLRVPQSSNEGPEMTVVGETEHLGKPDESIFAVRFMGDKGYVVTFRNIDPFYILDMSNPEYPHKTGELEIPGFSSYLHEIEIDGSTLIMGIGQGADSNGRQEGLKVSLFNVTDPLNPTETAFLVDRGYYSNAQHDFKSFRYLPKNQMLILPRSNNNCWNGGVENFDGFVVYDIKADNITLRDEINHNANNTACNGCWSDATMPPRSFVFKSEVTTVLSHSVISTDLDTGDTLWTMNLDEDRDTEKCYGYW